MKIDPIKNANIIKSYNNSDKSNNQNKLDSKKKDKVDISKDYATYDKALKKLNHINQKMRAEKVDKIAKAVRSGEYKVDTKETAKNIIKDVLFNK